MRVRGAEPYAVKDQRIILTPQKLQFTLSYHRGLVPGNTHLPPPLYTPATDPQILGCLSLLFIMVKNNAYSLHFASRFPTVDQKKLFHNPLLIGSVDVKTGNT